MGLGNMSFMHYLFWQPEIQERKSNFDFFITFFVISTKKRSAKMNPLIGSSEEDNAIIRKGECKSMNRFLVITLKIP
jgi:hypothetical protein